MSVIKNLGLLFKYFDEYNTDKSLIEKLEAGALMHQRFSNITFKIIHAGIDGLIVKTEQGKSNAENYADTSRLVELTKELFSITNPTSIHVHPSPYIPSVVEIVDTNWINDRMNMYKVRVKDLQFRTGVDKTNLSAWINGVRPMSQPVKAMFYYFFEWYIISNKLTDDAS